VKICQPSAVGVADLLEIRRARDRLRPFAGLAQRRHQDRDEQRDDADDDEEFDEREAVGGSGGATPA
jgi:hypothetical protein